MVEHGYDCAEVIRKVLFIEAYNLGSSQAIIRSFNPHNAIPTVTTHGFTSADDTIWQVWYYLAHGNRGFIGWVEGWFDGDKPKPRHDAVGPHYLEAGRKIGPLMSGAEWIHDGVADVRDERTAKGLGNGRQFAFDWPMNQAIVISFAGTPPRNP